MKTLFTVVIIISILFLFLWIINHPRDDDSDPKLCELKMIVMPIFKEKSYEYPLDVLNNHDIFHYVKIYEGKKSYTINKKKIYMCLRDKNGNYYSNNMLIYVLIHEIAHTICEDVGGDSHSEKFWEINDKLIKIAITKGIYDPTIPLIDDYCKY